jgi:hypothetical protein
MHDGQTIRMHLLASEASDSARHVNPDNWRDYTWITYTPTEDMPLQPHTMQRLVDMYLALAGERAHLKSEFERFHELLAGFLAQQQEMRAASYLRRMRWLVMYLGQPRASRFTTLSPGEPPAVSPALTEALARMSGKQRNLERTLDTLHSAALSSESQ